MNRVTEIIKYSQYNTEDNDFFSDSNIISIPVIDIIRELCERCDMVQEGNPENMLFSEELGNVKPWEALMTSYASSESSDLLADSHRETLLDRGEAGRISVDDILSVQLRRKMLEMLTRQIDMFARLFSLLQPFLFV